MVKRPTDDKDFDGLTPEARNRLEKLRCERLSPEEKMQIATMLGALALMMSSPFMAIRQPEYVLSVTLPLTFVLVLASSMASSRIKQQHNQDIIAVKNQELLHRLPHFTIAHNNDETVHWPQPESDERWKDSLDSVLNHAQDRLQQYGPHLTVAMIIKEIDDTTNEPSDEMFAIKAFHMRMLYETFPLSEQNNGISWEEYIQSVNKAGGPLDTIITLASHVPKPPKVVPSESFA